MDVSFDLTDAELMVLGAVLETDGGCLDELTITGADFADPHRGDLFDAMRAAKLNGAHVTYTTLADANPGQAAFIMSLTEHGRFAYAVEQHADIIATQALRRRLRSTAAALADRAENPQLDARALTEAARAMVDDAVGEQRQKVRFLRDIVPGVLTRMETGGQFVPSPWPSLDAAIGGLRPGTVTVVGARPAQGKTVIAGQIAVALAKHGPVAFSSLEMSEDELVARFISERIHIAVGAVKDGKMTDADWRRFAERRRNVDDLQIAIDDRAGVTAADIRQFARSVGRHGPLAGVVVDYLQLITGMNQRAERRVQIDEASRQLKVLAKDLRVPVIVLSQLNRESEKRADTRPKLSELKESGSIEQDADVVILLHREKTLAGHKITLDVAKNRHGETATVELKWEGALSRAVEWEDS